MREWDLNVQRMLDFIELNLEAPITLQHLARRLGYSPFYCTRKFRQVLGLSFREYLALRRLSMATLQLRDSNCRILDLAIRWGFGSQQAFGRAFKRAFGISPAVYRNQPVPLPLAPVRRTWMPLPLRDPPMTLEPIRITLQTLPAHGFLGLRCPGAQDYFDFWNRLKQTRAIDCHEVMGWLESIPSRHGQMGGWYQENGQHGYLYGIEVAEDYSGPVPEGMEYCSIPETTFAVFHHPPYDFERQESAVCKAIQHAMAAWDPEKRGFEFSEAIPTYQRHNPTDFGQAICRPLTALD